MAAIGFLLGYLVYRFCWYIGYRLLPKEDRKEMTVVHRCFAQIGYLNSPKVKSLLDKVKDICPVTMGSYYGYLKVRKSAGEERRLWMLSIYIEIVLLNVSGVDQDKIMDDVANVYVDPILDGTYISFKDWIRCKDKVIA